MEKNVTNTQVAVIGCGRWGANHVRVFAQEKALGTVVDASPAGRQRARELAHDIPVSESEAAALNDPAIRGVVVATPAETHYAIARRALEAGKDVFVEKPLTTNLREAMDLVARAQAEERILMVGHLLEYHPAILKLRELIETGALGKVYYAISNRLNLGQVRSEENALWSFAPHDISVILRLLGAMPCQVVATGGAYLQPNTADITLTQLLFDNGARAHIFVSWLHPFKEQKLIVIGSERMACFDDIHKELTLYDRRVVWEQGQAIPVRGEGTRVDYAADEPLHLACRAFLESIETRRSPRTDGVNGLRVLQVLDAAQRSMVSGSAIPLTTDIDISSRLLENDLRRSRSEA